MNETIVNQQPALNAGMNPAGNENDTDILAMVLFIYNTYVRGFWWIYLAAIVFFLFAGVIYLQTKKPVYRSTCQLHVSNNNIQVILF